MNCLDPGIHFKREIEAFDRTPLEVLSYEHGVTGLKVQNNETGGVEVIETDGIFVAIGQHPNTEFLEGQLETDRQGYLIVKAGKSETSIPGVFGCGDVKDPIYRQAITSAGSGAIAALDAERFLEDHQLPSELFKLVKATIQ